MKLKIYLERIKNVLVFGVLEQEGIERGADVLYNSSKEDFDISVGSSVGIWRKVIHIGYKSNDSFYSSITLHTEQEAIDLKDKILRVLCEWFGSCYTCYYDDGDSNIYFFEKQDYKCNTCKDKKFINDGWSTQKDIDGKLMPYVKHCPDCKPKPKSDKPKTKRYWIWVVEYNNDNELYQSSVYMDEEAKNTNGNNDYEKEYLKAKTNQWIDINTETGEIVDMSNKYEGGE